MNRFSLIFAISLLAIEPSHAQDAQGQSPSALSSAGAANSAMMSQYLMKEASKAKDSSTKNMLLMMMMQSQMQSQASQQASKKNKEREDKQESSKKEEENKVPTPQPLGKNPIEATKPEESLNMVETALAEDKKRSETNSQKESESSTSLDLPAFVMPNIKPLVFDKETEGPPAKSLSLSSSRTTLTATPMENKKEEANRNLSSLTEGRDRFGNPLMVNPGTSNAKTDAGTNGAPASAATSVSSAPRKTDESESAAAGSASSDDSSGSSSGSDDNFLASLMEQMNGPAPEEGAPHTEGGYESSDPGTPVNIFEYASVRYQQAAFDEKRISRRPY